VKLPDPYPGLVIRYAYLWRAEARRGQLEGTKDRPCAVVMVSARAESKAIDVMVVHITHTQPPDASAAVAIPGPTRARLGLDDLPCWAVVSEVNAFIWPGPDLRPTNPDDPATLIFGALPPKLLHAIKARLLARTRAGAAAKVPR